MSLYSVGHRHLHHYRVCNLAHLPLISDHLVLSEGTFGEFGSEDDVTHFKVNLGNPLVYGALGFLHPLVFLAQPLVVCQGFTPFLLQFVVLADFAESFDPVVGAILCVVVGYIETIEAVLVLAHQLSTCAQIEVRVEKHGLVVRRLDLPLIDGTQKVLLCIAVHLALEVDQSNVIEKTRGVLLGTLIIGSCSLVVVLQSQLV